jgi:branched-subunit amino acid aminotransferase/4-amino-4-deoxychorismate lyase
MDKVEARRRARAGGHDMAILRPVEGDVAEADAANVFLAEDGTVWTPPLSRGVLPGITRARVLAALRAAGRAVHEVPVHPAALARAEEVFVTSSLQGVVGIRRLGDRLFPGPGPLTAWLGDCVPPERETARPPDG